MLSFKEELTRKHLCKTPVGVELRALRSGGSHFIMSIYSNSLVLCACGIPWQWLLEQKRGLAPRVIQAEGSGTMT